MRNIYTKVIFLAVVLSAWMIAPLGAQTPEFYNNFGGTSTNSFPLNSTTSNKVQWVYAPGTLNSSGSSGNPAYAGLITKVYFRINTANPNAVYSDFTISLGQELGTANSFPSATYVTGLTECFYAATYSPTGAAAAQWFGVELQNPFPYDPNLSLIFEMKVSAGTGNSVAQVNVTGFNHRIWGGYAATSGSTGTGWLDFGVDIGGFPVPNNAGLTSLPSISDGFCADTIPVTATIMNFGNNVIDSVYVDWTVNSVAQPGQWHVLNLDTFGSGNNDTVITIGSYNFQVGNLYTVKAWTTMPNSENDTVNYNDTTEVTVGPAMAGTYVIGSSTNADFPSFTLAAAALNTLGVCDHVIFDVESGTYNEQITINSILGSGSDRTVTFRAQSLDSSDVTLFYEGTSGGTSVVTLNGADWIRFKHLTINNTSTLYDHAINITGVSKQVEIENCHFIGNYNSTSSNAAVLVSTTGLNDSITIRNNYFVGGGYAIYMYGSGTTSLENGLVIENNTLRDQYYHAIRLYYQNAPKVRNNSISSTSTYTTGAALYLVYCDNAMEVSGNHIFTDPASTNPWPYYGMYLSSSDGTGFTNTGRIFNNRIVIGADTNTSSTGAFYGMYITSTNAQRIANNSVTVMNGGSTTRPIYQTSSDLLFIRNNLFSVYGPGHAAYYNSGIAVDIDRNNYYAPNGTAIYYGGMNFDVETFKQATGYDSNSFQVDPQWSDIYNAFLCNDVLDGIASPLSYVATDYSGFARSMTQPDPGAVEFIGVNNFTLGPDTTVCGNSYSLEVSGATSNLLWQVNGSPSSNSSVTMNNTGSTPAQYNVNVSVTSATGCGSAADNVLVTLVPNASLDSSTHVCADASAALTPGGGTSATYFWTPTGETTANISVSTPGIYTVTKNEMGCVSHASTIVSKSDSVSLLDVEICDDDMPYSVSAVVPNGQSYAWSGGATPTTQSNTFDAAGTYSVTVSDIFGCISDADFDLTVIDEPTALITHTHYGNLFLFSSAMSSNVGSNASYFWTFGDGSTSTDPNPQHLYAWSPEEQTFVVTLMIVNDCGSGQFSTTVVSDPVGLEEVAPASWSIYPNPASDDAAIIFSGNARPGTLEVLDVLGKKTAEFSIVGTTQQEIDLSGLAKGSYVVKFLSDGSISTQRLIIQ